MFSEDIFDIRNEEQFSEFCLRTFYHQYNNVEVYHDFVDFLKVQPHRISEVEKIPFLPIEIFKSKKILDRISTANSYFQSSGTTQIQTRSRHYIADFSLYEKSLLKSFENFIGNPEDYLILGLLPNYSENPHSSLIYMVDFLMKKSGNKKSGYFLYNHRELLEIMLKNSEKPILLFGVSFALLDFLDFLDSQNKQLITFNLTLIETGGMKGRKTEMTKDDLLEIFRMGFKTDKIFSEYSMTELLSQAYSLGKNIYETPNWMKVLIRSNEDPFQYLDHGRAGVINIIDLANIHSCSFIATQDIGISGQHIPNKSIHQTFSVNGRVDHSDIRGCSLLVSN